MIEGKYYINENGVLSLGDNQLLGYVGASLSEISVIAMYWGHSLEDQTICTIDEIKS